MGTRGSDTIASANSVVTLCRPRLFTIKTIEQFRNFTGWNVGQDRYRRAVNLLSALQESIWLKVHFGYLGQD